MASIFSKIIARDIPCHEIAENDKFIAFLDITPIREGHTLVVPKVEVDNIFDVDDTLLAEWLVFAKPVAKAIERTFPCDRCGISVIGLEVPHAHMHLVPIDTADDLNFTRKKLSVSQDDLKATKEKILANM